MGTNVFFVLADALSDGRPFDGLATGEFRDMFGRPAKFEADDMPAYIQNTLAAIEATRSESGEIVGLPIDANGHDHGDSAGWIVDAEIGQRELKAADGTAETVTVVRLKPKWTEVGRDLISRGIRRFFSATVDLAEKVVLGGTLTNWPATRRDDGRIVLRPVELAQDSSQDAAEIFVPYVEVEPGAVPGDVAKTITTTNATTTLVIPVVGSDVELPETPVEPATKGAAELVAASGGTVDTAAGDLLGNHEQGEIENMNSEEVKALIDAKVEAALEARVTAAAVKSPNGTDPEPGADDGDSFNVLEFLQLEDLGDGVTDTVKEMLLSEYGAMQDRAKLEGVKFIADMKRENTIAEFVHKATAGTDDTPRGLSIDEKRLGEWMNSLNRGQLEFAQELIGGILDKTGLLEFEELGHAKRIRGTGRLPQWAAVQLAAWVEAGNKSAEYFDMNSDILDDMAAYDLAAFKGVTNG